MRNLICWRKILPPFVVSLFLTFLILNVQASKWIITSTTIDTPIDGNIRAFDFINSDDGWAVGDNGIILHWDGTSWNNMTSLNIMGSSVKMISSSEVWILGEKEMFHLQLEEENSNIPIEYLLVISSVIAVILVYFFIRKRFKI